MKTGVVSNKKTAALTVANATCRATVQTLTTSADFNIFEELLCDRRQHYALLPTNHIVQYNLRSFTLYLVVTSVRL